VREDRRGGCVPDGKLIVNGATDLGAATLSLSVASQFTAPSAHTAVDLIRNVSNAPIIGTFAGLPNNSILVLGGRRFRIRYFFGHRHDVTLTLLA